MGGRIVRDARGKITGVFEENAMGLIEKPFYTWKNLRSEAEKIAAFENLLNSLLLNASQRASAHFRMQAAIFGNLLNIVALQKRTNSRCVSGSWPVSLPPTIYRNWLIFLK